MEILTDGEVAEREAGVVDSMLGLVAGGSVMVVEETAAVVMADVSV